MIVKNSGNEGHHSRLPVKSKGDKRMDILFDCIEGAEREELSLTEEVVGCRNGMKSSGGFREGPIG